MQKELYIARFVNSLILIALLLDDGSLAQRVGSNEYLYKIIGIYQGIVYGEYTPLYPHSNC